ncbi:hypothetical protein [Spirosoma sp. KNUC1025]|uniref:hypothetical protein n=1 Tax=Spirosoma sp. KNUC1025 TaxID=2894082 RepID=UPI003864661A|nr:hypothetical protein LN737_19205 [Spirosoma sp. KNUC1025]
MQESKIGQMPLTLGGIAYTLFFDYVFVSLLNQPIDGKPFDEITKAEPMRLIPLLTLLAIKAGDDVNDLSNLPTERQVSRMLMEAGQAVNRAILENYQHSMGFIGAVFQETVKVAVAVDKGKNTK